MLLATKVPTPSSTVSDLGDCSKDEQLGKADPAAAPSTCTFSGFRNRCTFRALSINRQIHSEHAPLLKWGGEVHHPIDCLEHLLRTELLAPWVHQIGREAAANVISATLGLSSEPFNPVVLWTAVFWLTSAQRPQSEGAHGNSPHVFRLPICVACQMRQTATISFRTTGSSMPRYGATTPAFAGIAHYRGTLTPSDLSLLQPRL